MKNIVSTYVEKFIADHRKTRRIASLLLGLALLVSAGVFWQLHSTGIALTNETYCGLEEHTHSEECYEEVLVCGLEEGEDHTHDASCYEEQLVCGMEEHTHTMACMSDETADVETADDWEATLPALTGVWPDDVAVVAESQLGYTESTANFILDEDGETCRGYTRYGAWAGNEYGVWDAMFASFCLYYAGVPAEEIPESTGAYAWSVKLEEAGLYVDGSGDETPEAGDLVFFDRSGDGTADAVGIVTGVSGTGMTVIEGDSNDRVEENSYSIGSAAGYVDISAACDSHTGNDVAEAEDETGEEDGTGSEAEGEGVSGTESGAEEGTGSGAEAVEETAAETKTYTAADGGVDLTVTAPAGALPEGAELTVTLFDEDSDAYTAAGETVNYDADDEDTGLAAMDISFWADGEEVEPSEAVTVSMDASALLPDEADASTIEVQHLTETEDGVEAALVADVSEGVDADTVTIEFEVESFSTFTITWSTGNRTSTSITATTYLYGTESTIGSGSTSLTGTSGTAFDLTASNSDLEIDGYTLVSASLTYNGTTYSDVTAVTVTISQSSGGGGGPGGGNNTTYTYSYTDSTGTTTQLYSGSSSQTLTVSLYYVEDAGITISGTGSDSEGYTLTATTAGSYTYTDKVWSIDDSSLAEMIVNDDGTVTVNWTEDAVAGDTVTVTVTSTYTDYLGETVTVTDTCTLTNGTVSVTIHTTYGTNSSTAAGASVALLDADGNIVAYGTTDSNGDVTFNVPAGTYTVEATYYTTGTSSGGQGGGQSQSSSTGYSYSGSLTVSAETAQTVNLTADTYSPYDHVDIRVTGGEYSLTIETDDGTTTIEIPTYAYAGSSFTVTLPDGTVLSGTAEYSDTEVEYRLTGQTISSSWDNEDDYGKFSIDVSVLLSLSELREYLTDSEIESIFGVSLADGSSDLVTYESETNGVPAGTYIIVDVTGYHPDENVCEGTAGRDRGYDFVIDLSSALTYLTDQLMVYKYVVDEDGNIIEDDTSFTFTLTKSDDSSVNKTTSLVSGESDVFSDIEAGYYYITESAADGYIPVTLDENGNISETGYVQYVQSATKESGSIPSVTFYNMKMETVGVVTLKKGVDDEEAEGTYAGGTFTFLLYAGDDTEGYTLVESLGEISITDGESTEFYLAAGTYTIVELGSTLADNDAQTVTINGTTLTRVVAGEDDPYGLDEGTVYYVGTITVTAGSSLTYTATNTYVASYLMPSTGGFGTWPYTLIGFALCGGAAAILCRRRRRA
ncbi:MAG: CHAP domain-containing protein [Clostridiales bacterium]|nr:CHAP domain-containing protein [Clostridiales bacterium]